jgi:hypothetical protein
VFAPRKAFLFRSGNDLAVNYESRCRIVKNGIDTENAHEGIGSLWKRF